MSHIGMEEIRKDVCQLKKDMIVVCNDLKWVKRIGSVIAVAMVALFFKGLF